jgi:hypothetical protein
MDEGQGAKDEDKEGIVRWAQGGFHKSSRNSRNGVSFQKDI